MDKFDGTLEKHDFDANWLIKIEKADTQFEIFSLMRQLSEHYAYRAFVVAHLPDLGVTELASTTIITNGPPELLTLFDRGKFMGSSPVIRRIRASVLPFQYHFKEVAKERGSDDVMQLFDRFGMDGGVVFPVYDADGQKGWVGFAGSAVNLTLQQLMQLSYLCLHVYQKLADLKLRDVKTTEPLADRELACLTWTAAGKTSAEIAEILELSEHTVNHYLNRATKKLDAVNRTQAVAKAIRRNLIA